MEYVFFFFPPIFHWSRPVALLWVLHWVRFWKGGNNWKISLYFGVSCVISVYKCRRMGQLTLNVFWWGGQLPVWAMISNTSFVNAFWRHFLLLSQFYFLCVNGRSCRPSVQTVVIPRAVMSVSNILQFEERCMHLIAFGGGAGAVRSTNGVWEIVFCTHRALFFIHDLQSWLGWLLVFESWLKCICPSIQTCKSEVLFGVSWIIAKPFGVHLNLFSDKAAPFFRGKVDQCGGSWIAFELHTKK